MAEFILTNRILLASIKRNKKSPYVRQRTFKILKNSHTWILVMYLFFGDYDDLFPRSNSRTIIN